MLCRSPFAEYVCRSPFTFTSSRGSAILVDEAAKAITTLDVPSWHGGERDRVNQVIGR